MSRFDFTDTPLAGTRVVTRKALEDARGFLCRLFCADGFREAGADLPVAQINHTLTRRRGSIRGLHFQRSPHAEVKLVSCLRGEVFDVAVDLRRGSPTFLRWFGTVLSADNRSALLIPEGCAHGFQTLTDDCELIYLHSAAYHPGAEGAVNALDPRLAIDWPLAVAEMSARDRDHPPIDDAFEGLAP